MGEGGEPLVGAAPAAEATEGDGAAVDDGTAPVNTPACSGRFLRLFFPIVNASRGVMTVNTHTQWEDTVYEEGEKAWWWVWGAIGRSRRMDGRYRTCWIEVVDFSF
jgi:hypothetical protein